ncbi:MAG: TIGR03862 family flavoprotein [Acidimicrobiales bacterium]
MPPTVAVVGAGPAGLMAAEVLASAGAAVTVYEMHRSPGRKLLLAGRSGLNLTHREPLHGFLGRYEPATAALTAAIEAFPPEQVRAWAEGLGQPTFVGSSGRVFPEAHRAAPLLRAWLDRLAGLGVELATSHRWVGWEGDRLRFSTPDGERVVDVDASVIALGGASWPRVGSDGGWVATFTADGTEVEPLRPSNCGVVVDWSDVFRERFEGHPIKNVVVRWGERSVRGELVVTRDGLEGGPVYALSGTLGRTNRFPTSLVLDLAPDLDAASLVDRCSRRRPKESQSTWLRGVGLEPVVAGLLREATGNRIPDDPAELATLVKAAPVEVRRLASIDRAISTAGGVAFAALDVDLMMRSRPGVFLAGEMLDWDAPTGGYLLQACFSTGHRAGRAAASFVGLDS